MEFDPRQYLESARKLSLERELQSPAKDAQEQPTADGVLDTSFKPSLPDACVTVDALRVERQVPQELDRQIRELNEKTRELSALMALLQSPKKPEKEWRTLSKVTFGLQITNAVLQFGMALGQQPGLHLFLGCLWGSAAALTYFTRPDSKLPPPRKDCKWDS